MEGGKNEAPSLKLGDALVGSTNVIVYHAAPALCVKPVLALELFIFLHEISGCLVY